MVDAAVDRIRVHRADRNPMPLGETSTRNATATRNPHGCYCQSLRSTHLMIQGSGPRDGVYATADGDPVSTDSPTVWEVGASGRSTNPGFCSSTASAVGYGHVTAMFSHSTGTCILKLDAKDPIRLEKVSEGAVRLEIPPSTDPQTTPSAHAQSHSGSRGPFDRSPIRDRNGTGCRHTVRGRPQPARPAV
jgi:hypothetical protein